MALGMNRMPIGGRSLETVLPRLHEHGEPQWNDIGRKTKKTGRKYAPVPLRP
jgi:hypothetical protein